VYDSAFGFPIGLVLVMLWRIAGLRLISIGFEGPMGKPIYFVKEKKPYLVGRVFFSKAVFYVCVSPYFGLVLGCSTLFAHFIINDPK
jgi:hypothetical protein